MFIEFPLKVVINGETKRPNERKADIHLGERLKESEAPTGIFNWVLEGYKELETTGYFTETAEAEDLKEQFK